MASRSPVTLWSWKTCWVGGTGGGSTATAPRCRKWFEVNGTTFPDLHFLMDGSLVMRSAVQHEYKLRIEDAKASTSDLPEWLQQRFVNQFSVVRFGKG